MKMKFRIRYDEGEFFGWSATTVINESDFFVGSYLTKRAAERGCRRFTRKVNKPFPVVKHYIYTTDGI